MKVFFKAMIITLMITCSSVMAQSKKQPEYPKELRGYWSEGKLDSKKCSKFKKEVETKNWETDAGSIIFIDKDTLTPGYIVDCEPKKVKKLSEGSYVIKELCHSEGEEGPRVLTYTVQGNKLKIYNHEYKSSNEYVNCFSQDKVESRSSNNAINFFSNIMGI